MTEYKKEYQFNNLFPPEVPQNTLAEWLSKKSFTQYHCAGNDVILHSANMANSTLHCM